MSAIVESPPEVAQAVRVIQQWAQERALTNVRFGLLYYSTAPVHCATCQCNKFPPTPPQPENPRSKSWHENALTAPPK